MSFNYIYTIDFRTLVNNGLLCRWDARGNKRPRLTFLDSDGRAAKRRERTIDGVNQGTRWVPSDRQREHIIILEALQLYQSELKEEIHYQRVISSIRTDLGMAEQKWMAKKEVKPENRHLWWAPTLPKTIIIKSFQRTGSYSIWIWWCATVKERKQMERECKQKNNLLFAMDPGEKCSHAGP